MTIKLDVAALSAWREALSAARAAIREVNDLQELYIYKSKSSGSYLVLHRRVPNGTPRDWTLVKIVRRDEVPQGLGRLLG